MKAMFRKYLSVIILVIIFGAWIFYIYQNLPMIMVSLANINPAFFIYSTVFLAFIYYIQAYVWHRINRDLGIDIGLSTSNRIWFLTNLSKYIPGKVWIILSKGYYGRKENVSAKRMVFSGFLELYLAITTATILITVHQFIFNEQLVVRSLWALSSVSLLIALFKAKWLLRRSMGLTSRLERFGKIKIGDPEEIAERTRTRGFLANMLIYFFVWALYGIWLSMIISSLSPSVTMQIFSLSFVWVFSFVIGFLVLVVPSGIGVREGAMAAVLSTMGFPASLSLLIPILTRFESIIVDGFLGLMHLRRGGRDRGRDFLVLRQTLGYERYNVIRDAIKRTKSEEILDVGCGTGHNLISNSDLIGSSVGIDISEERLRLARKYAEKNKAGMISFRRMSGFGISLNKKFDMLLLTEILEHVQEDERFLRSSLKNLKSGGYVLITAPSKNSLFQTIGKLRDMLGDREHVRPGYTIDELRSMLLKNGVTTIRSGYRGQFFSTIIHCVVTLIGFRRDVTIASDSRPRSFYLYSLLWPIIKSLIMFDRLIPPSKEGGFVYLLGKKS